LFLFKREQKEELKKQEKDLVEKEKNQKDLTEHLRLLDSQINMGVFDNEKLKEAIESKINDVHIKKEEMLAYDKKKKLIISKIEDILENMEN
jgi:hypothetical protein